MNINVTPILETVIGLIVTVLSVIVIPKIKVWLSNKLTSSQINIIQTIVCSAVLAAEQIYAQAEKSGSSKKKFVMEYVENKLAEFGMTVDSKEIEIYIEQAVLELKQSITVNVED